MNTDAKEIWVVMELIRVENAMEVEAKAIELGAKVADAWRMECLS